MNIEACTERSRSVAIFLKYNNSVLKYFLILCCFICVQDEPHMSWDEAYKLTWEDFQGEPNLHSSAVAITASGLTFGFSIKERDDVPVSFTTEVYAHFYPEQSWYKLNLADDHVLGHEQLHFDVTELHARKFRQRISQLKLSNNIKSELRRLGETMNKELQTMQQKYDSETDYSRNEVNQAKWKLYIKSELDKLSRYKSVD